MTTPIFSKALSGALPEGLPDVDGLPTLAAACRALFDETLPGVLGQGVYLLRCETPLVDGLHRIVAAHTVESLLDKACQGVQPGDDELDPGTTVLSTRIDSVAPEDQFTGATLSGFRQALRAIERSAIRQRFTVDQQTYWDVPADDQRSPRRQLQALQLRESLSGDLALLQASNLLKAESVSLIEDIVRHPRASDRTQARGVYSLQMQAKGSGASFTLPGMLVLAEDPGTVSGEVVLFCAGYFGFIGRFDSLARAMTILTRMLNRHAASLSTILCRLPPDDQQSLLAERARTGAGFTLLPQVMDGNPFEVLAEQQIDAWQRSALAENPMLWHPQIGLDASPAHRVRELRAFEAQRKQLRAHLPEGLRELGAERQELLDRLLEQAVEQQLLADQQWSMLPSFEAYASGRVREALLAEGVDIDPAEVQVQITQTVYIPEGPDTGGSGLVPAQGHRVTTVVDYRLLDYVSLRMDAKVDNWTAELLGLTAAQMSVLSLKRLATIAQTLDLQEQYQATIRAALLEPDAPADNAAFVQRREAAVALFETRLRLDALVANACGDLDDSGYQAVLDVLEHPDPNTRPLREGQRALLETLSLSGNTFRDVFVFRESDESSLVCYLPGYPGGRPFKRFTSRGAMRSTMTRDLAGIEQPTGWSETVRYWVSRFGRHQQVAALPALIAIAKNKAGAELTTVALDRPLGQATFEYRVGYLLAEADSLAVSDAELRLDKALEVLNTVFRILSFLLPARVMTALDLAELGYYLFNGYAAYSSGQRQQAGEYLLEALTSVSGLFNGKFFKRQRHPGAPSPMRLHVAPQGPSMGAISHVQGSDQLFHQLGSGPRQGLYVHDAKLHVQLQDGHYYPVYEVTHPLQQGSQFRLGQGDTPLSRSLFSNPDPLLERDPWTGKWQVVRRPGLHGGMELPAPKVTMQAWVTRKVETDFSTSQLRHRIDDGDRLVTVEFDLQHCRWYAEETGTYYQFDATSARYLQAPDGGPLASAVERQRALAEFGLGPRPMLPGWQPVTAGEVIPRDIHQIWIGTSDSMSRLHGDTLAANASMAQSSGYRLHVHYLGESGWGPFKRVLLERRYPKVQFEAVRDAPAFEAFQQSAAGRVFDFYTKTPSQNLAAASDVLRYWLLRQRGGVYLDMDDRLNSPLPELNVRPGHVGVGHVVEHDALALKGPNNSHFASLAGNPLLDDMLEAVAERFDKPRFAQCKLVPRPKEGAPSFAGYMSAIAEVTGPVMFNALRNRRQPACEALTQAKIYANDLALKGVRVEQDVLDWIEEVAPVLAPLEGFFTIGNANSWKQGRR